MKVLGNLKNNQELTVVKNGGLYEYYLDNKRIGVFEPQKMKDKILFLDALEIENTIENEEMASIKDEIAEILDNTDKEEILSTNEEYSKAEIEGMEWQLGGKIKKVNLLGEVDNSDKQKDRNKEEDKDIADKSESAEIEYSTLEDVYITTKVNMNTRVVNGQTVETLLKTNGKLPELEAGESWQYLVGIEYIPNHDLKDKDGKKVETNQNEGLAIVSNKGKVIPLEAQIDHSKADEDKNIDYHTDEYGKTKVNYVEGEGEISIGKEVTLSLKTNSIGETDIYSTKNQECSQYITVTSYDGINRKEVLYSRGSEERTLARYNQEIGHDTDEKQVTSKDININEIEDTPNNTQYNRQRATEIYNSSEFLQDNSSINEIEGYLKNHGNMTNEELEKYIKEDLERCIDHDHGGVA